MGESRDTEVCWYLTGTREQFRLSGVLDMITPESDPAMVNPKTGPEPLPEDEFLASRGDEIGVAPPSGNIARRSWSTVRRALSALCASVWDASSSCAQPINDLPPASINDLLLPLMA